MIKYILGLPGSGKSAYAVDRIFNNFSDDEGAKKDKKVTFKNCYTNINEFKYDKVKNVHKLDFDKLYDILKRLQSFTKGKNKKDDKYLLKFCSRLKIKDTLFVIDEAHNFFDKKDNILVWWLSYHRHLHHEIILITQNLSLIESKYKAFSEFFYVAKPTSLKLFKSDFKYNVFTHSRLSKSSSVGSIKLKKNDKVFALYHSGDSVITSNIILKYIIISFFILLLLISFFYFFISSKSSDSNELIKNDVISKQSNVTNQYKKSLILEQDDYNEDIQDSQYIDKTFFILSCSYSKCTNDLISIPPKLLYVFIHNKSINVLYKERINKNLINFYLDSTKEFYKYLTPKNKENYEQDTKNSDNKLDLGFLPTVGKQ